MESSRPSRSRAPHRKGKSLNKWSKPAYGVFVEFCCSPQSNLGKVSESAGVKHVRLTKANGDFARFDVQEQLLEVLDWLFGVENSRASGFLECKPLQTCAFQWMHGRTVASTDDSFIRCLRTKTCDHNHTHVQLKGSKAPKSAFYLSKMCECIIATIVPGYLSQSCSKHVL